MPPHFLPRPEELARLKGLLLQEHPSVEITERQRLGVQGMGGIGKTVLAIALTRDPEVQRRFTDGIYWLTLGLEPQLAQLQSRLATALSGEAQTLADVAEGREFLRQQLQGRRCLLVLDDVWSGTDVKALDVVDGEGRLLLTTRDREVMTVLGAQEYRLQLLSDPQALTLLAGWAGESVEGLRGNGDAIATMHACGNLPLALALCGAMVRDGILWSDLREALAEADLSFIEKHFPGYPYTDVLKALGVSIAALERRQPAAAQRYRELAVLPADVAVPEAAVLTLWQYTSQLSPRQGRRLLSRLTAKGLLQQDLERPHRYVTLHNLQRSYLQAIQSEAGGIATLHQQMLAAYAAHCSDGWATGPDDGYYLQQLPFHLYGAGQQEELRSLLLSYRWLQTKLLATGINGLLADYDWLPDTDLQRIQGTLRLSAHLLSRHPDQLGERLWGHLRDISSPGIWSLLHQAQKRAWLRPRWANLASPEGALRRTLVGHQDSVLAVTLLAAGRRALSASDDGTLKLWDLPQGLELKTLWGHGSWIKAVAVSADGRRALSAAYDCTLKLWDLDRGKELISFQGHRDAIWAVAMTPDGRLGISASADGTLKLWDLPRGRELRTLRGHQDSVWSVAVSADGRRAVSASSDETLKLWDLQTGVELNTLEGHTDTVWSVALSGDGRRALSASSDLTLKLWDLESGRELRTLLGHRDAVLCAAIDAAGRRGVSGSDDLTLKLWDLDTGTELKTLEGHSDSVLAVAISPNGERAASASDDLTLKVWDLQRSVQAAPDGHQDSVLGIALSQDGTWAVSASYDGTLKRWDVGQGQEVITYEGHSDAVWAVAVSPDGRQVVSASADLSVRLWSASLGIRQRTLLGHEDAVLSVAFSPDGREILSASDDMTVRLWDARIAIPLLTLESHRAAVLGVAFSPDGQRALSASADLTLRLWDLNGGELLEVFKGHEDWVRAVAFHPSGDYAISAADDNTLKLWDLRQGQVVKTFRSHQDWIRAVSLSPDGTRLVSASQDRTLKLWELVSGQCVATFCGDSPFLSCAVGEADGQLVVVAGDQGGTFHGFDWVP